MHLLSELWLCRPGRQHGPGDDFAASKPDLLTVARSAAVPFRLEDPDGNHLWIGQVESA